MSAATLPKTSPPPRGAPSLNGCSGAPGVTRSPLSMEQGDLPRSVNKLQAGVVSLSAPNPKTGAPEPGSYVCTSERGSVQRWHVGPCSGCIGGGVEACRPPEPWGKARAGDRGARGRRQGAQRAECRHSLGRLMASWASAETRPAGVGAAGGVDPARSRGVQSPLTH